GLRAAIGERCLIEPSRRGDTIPAEVVGFRDGKTLLMPLGEMSGIGPGNRVIASGSAFDLVVGEELLGRVVDGLGRPIDGGLSLQATVHRTTAGGPPDSLRRTMIESRLELGVRALDTLVPCGKGQRLGIFAGSGVGKSSLLGMIARDSSADVNVICLVGERG